MCIYVCIELSLASHNTLNKIKMCCSQLHEFSKDMRAEVLDPCTQSEELDRKSMRPLILPRTVDRRRTLSAAYYRFSTPAYSIVVCIYEYTHVRRLCRTTISERVFLDIDMENMLLHINVHSRYNK
jgi:hypothetical protein